MFKKNAIIHGVLLSLLVGASPASAEKLGGREGGNGGEARICGGRVYMLDSYEGIRRGLIPAIDERASARATFNLLNSRIGRFLPELAAELAKDAEPFLEDIANYPTLPTQRMPNGKIQRRGRVVLWTTDPSKFSGDTGITWTADGCQEVMLIKNQAPRVEEDREYEIFSPTWEVTSAAEQGIGVMHEVLYKRTRAADAAKGLTEFTSFAARYMNEYLLTSKFDSMSVCDYFKNYHAKVGFEVITRPTSALRCGLTQSRYDFSSAQMISEPSKEYSDLCRIQLTGFSPSVASFVAEIGCSGEDSAPIWYFKSPVGKRKLQMVEYSLAKQSARIDRVLSPAHADLGVVDLRLTREHRVLTPPPPFSHNWKVKMIDRQQVSAQWNTATGEIRLQDGSGRKVQTGALSYSVPPTLIFE